MSTLNAIIEGHVNEALKDDDQVEAMASARLKKCKTCPARAAHPVLGERCSSKQLIEHVEPFSEELINRLKQFGYKYIIQNGAVRVRGCGCRLQAKTRVRGEECPAGKWKAEF